MLMAKQPTRPTSSDASGDRPAQPEKPRRARAGGNSGRTEAQATAAPAPEIADTFAARSTADQNRPAADRNQPEDVSQSENRSESMSSSPSEEDIRMRAYQRYLERGGGHGMDFEDWLEAERELRRQK
jgi:hypothetical protein